MQGLEFWTSSRCGSLVHNWYYISWPEKSLQYVKYMCQEVALWLVKETVFWDSVGLGFGCFKLSLDFNQKRKRLTSNTGGTCRAAVWKGIADSAC